MTSWSVINNFLEYVPLPSIIVWDDSSYLSLLQHDFANPDLGRKLSTCRLTPRIRFISPHMPAEPFLSRLDRLFAHRIGHFSMEGCLAFRTRPEADHGHRFSD